MVKASRWLLIMVGILLIGCGVNQAETPTPPPIIEPQIIDTESGVQWLLPDLMGHEFILRRTIVGDGNPYVIEIGVMGLGGPSPTSSSRSVEWEMVCNGEGQDMPDLCDQHESFYLSHGDHYSFEITLPAGVELIYTLSLTLHLPY